MCSQPLGFGGERQEFACTLTLKPIRAIFIVLPTAFRLQIYVQHKILILDINVVHFLLFYRLLCFRTQKKKGVKCLACTPCSVSQTRDTAISVMGFLVNEALTQQLKLRETFPSSLP